MNKKGFISPTIIIVIAVLGIIGMILGIAFFGKINTAIQDAISQLGTTRTIIVLIIILAVIFHKFTETLLMTILAWIKRL